MDRNVARSRGGAGLVAIAVALALAGCGGGSSSDSGSQATDAPASFAPASGEQHHRHHRHGRHAYDRGAASSAAPVAAASPGGGAWPCDDRRFESDRQQLASGSLQGDQEVDVCGTVTRVLASRVTRSGLHGYFYLQVAPGDTVEIVSDLGEMDAPAWPWVKAGDYSYVQGRYYFDSASSQGIDWTHHGTSRSWPSAGYVVVDGTEYE